MNKTAILKEVNEALRLGQTVIITPESMTAIWSQPEVERIPHVSATEEIDGRLYGLFVDGENSRSHIRILGYGKRRKTL